MEYKDLEEKLEKLNQDNLATLLRPIINELAKLTTNPFKFAIILLAFDILDEEQHSEFLAEKTEYKQNMAIYLHVIKKGAGGCLIRALYKSNNRHILKLIEKQLKDGTDGANENGREGTQSGSTISNHMKNVKSRNSVINQGTITVFQSHP